MKGQRKKISSRAFKNVLLISAKSAESLVRAVPLYFLAGGVNNI